MEVGSVKSNCFLCGLLLQKAISLIVFFNCFFVAYCSGANFFYFFYFLCVGLIAAAMGCGQRSLALLVYHALLHV